MTTQTATNAQAAYLATLARDYARTTGDIGTYLDRVPGVSCTERTDLNRIADWYDEHAGWTLPELTEQLKANAWLRTAWTKWATATNATAPENRDAAPAAFAAHQAAALRLIAGHIATHCDNLDKADGSVLIDYIKGSSDAETYSALAAMSL